MSKIIHSFNYPDYEFLNMSRKILSFNINLLSENGSFKYFQFGPEIIGTRDYDNKVVNVQNLLSINNTLLYQVDKVCLIIIDMDGIDKYPKYRWFQRMDKKQILESNLWFAKIIRNSLNYKSNMYFDSSRILNNRLIEYSVSEKPSSQKELYDIIYNSNLYFIQPWNQVYNSSSRNA